MANNILLFLFFLLLPSWSGVARTAAAAAEETAVATVRSQAAAPYNRTTTNSLRRRLRRQKGPRSCRANYRLHIYNDGGMSDKLMTADMARFFGKAYGWYGCGHSYRDIRGKAGQYAYWCMADDDESHSRSSSCMMSYQPDPSCIGCCTGRKVSDYVYKDALLAQQMEVCQNGYRETGIRHKRYFFHTTIEISGSVTHSLLFPKDDCHVKIWQYGLRGPDRNVVCNGPLPLHLCGSVVRLQSGRKYLKHDRGEEISSSLGDSVSRTRNRRRTCTRWEVACDETMPGRITLRSMCSQDPKYLADNNAATTDRPTATGWQVSSSLVREWEIIPENGDRVFVKSTIGNGFLNAIRRTDVTVGRGRRRTRWYIRKVYA